MDVQRECDLEAEKKIQPSDVDCVLEESDSKLDMIQPLDINVLKQCGELVSEYFKRYLINDLSDDDDYSTDSSSNSSYREEGETYMDASVRQKFDWVYDFMSQNLEKADHNYQTQPKLKFYHDLKNFVQYNKVHEINRYVFGNGQCNRDWGTKAIAALETVRAWRMRYQDEIERLPDILIETYATAADRADAQPFDVAMVAFAVFGFLLGYDKSVDFELVYTFRDIEAVHGSTTDFRQVRNSVTRNARMFLETNGTETDREFFETLAHNPDVVAVCKWIYDLTASRPDSVERLASNPFGKAARDVTASSDTVRSRVFYRWISREIFALLSGASQRRISLLDHHVQRCLNCCLGTRSGLRMFNDTYDQVLVHFTKILADFDCPEPMMETLRSTWNQKAFKNLIKRRVKKIFDRNSNLRYRDSSTDSNDSTE